MVRPYAVKGLKRKTRDEADDVGEEEEEEETTTLGEEEDDDEKKAEDAVHELPGIPIVPSDQKSKSGVIFVLERASLEVAKVGKTYQILNSDDHANFLRKHNRNPNDYRPDIVHQALLAILDSPLNKAGRLQALYVRTEKGVLFEVKPHVRMPRTFKRFCGIMLQLLQKLSISATSKREKLLHVIKNPVTRHLPVNSRKIGLSYSSDKLVQLRDYVAAASDDVNLVFICPHDGSCPLENAGKYCHFVQRLEKTSSQRAYKHWNQKKCHTSIDEHWILKVMLLLRGFFVSIMRFASRFLISRRDPLS